MHAQDAPPPWYRQFWPWFLIFLPASAVVAGIATLVIAIENPDGLVVDDYYKEGLAINRDLGRDQVAKELELSADVNIDPSHGTVAVTMHGAGTERLPAVRLRLLHPTRARHDEDLMLTAGADGRFQGKLGELPPGNWHVQIEPPGDRWRLHGRLLLPAHHHVTLDPAS